jgi:DNA repair exonuclease SbcCD nuclease subunit
MRRVIHTGDTHIGYRQYNSPERRRDFLAAFEAVVEDAVETDVDAVVHAGDLFHDRRPDLEDLLGTLAALRRLEDAGVPFLAVVGNHESTHGGQWLDLFAQLGLAVRLGSRPYRVGDVALYGLDHVPPSRRDGLAYDFEANDADHAALVAHGQFAPLVPDVRGDAWDLEAVFSASPVAFDAALLGDDHTPAEERVAGVTATYCGSTERASASEQAGRGYNLVRFDDAGVDVRRRAIETRPFVFVSVDLAPGEGGDRVREQVRQHDLADAVVVVEVTGDGEPVTPASVEEAALAGGALVARVTDRRDVEATDDADAVSFADPDAAVRERVDSMGLSEAAREVDQLVRTGTLADSNVREAVATRVEQSLDDPRFFEPAASNGEDGTMGATGETAAGDGDRDPTDADATGVDEAEAGPDDGAAEAHATTPAPVDGGDPSPAGDGDSAAEADAGDGSTPPDDAESVSGADDEPPSGSDGGTAPDADQPREGGDGQASMEDYR